MARFDHLLRLSRVVHYRSQRGRVNRLRMIEAGGEELEFITAGTGLLDGEDGKVQRVTRGAVLWHVAGEYTVSRFPPEDPYECVVVRFEVRGKPKRQVPRVTLWADPGEASVFASELLHTFQRGGYDPFVFCHYVYGRFFWHAHVAAQRAARSPTAGKQAESPFPEALSRALSIIDARYLDAISVDELSEIVGYSPAHLHHLFRQHLKQSPYQIITERRLDHARRLLATSEVAVKEVGAQSGFADAVTFSRVFRRHLGQTPVAYRKAHAPPVSYHVGLRDLRDKPGRPRVSKP